MRPSPALISAATSEKISAMEEELPENSFSLHPLVFSEVDSLYLDQDLHIMFIIQDDIKKEKNNTSINSYLFDIELSRDLHESEKDWKFRGSPPSILLDEEDSLE